MARRPGRPQLTRRGFLRAAATGVAASAAVGVLAGCAHTTEEVTSDPVVMDEDDAVSVLDVFESVDEGLTQDASWSLPLGNVLLPSEGNWVPALTAGSSATPMVVGSALSLESGSLVSVLTEARGNAATTVIYDVRCSDSVYAWVELDLTTRDWVLFASRFSAGSLTGDVTTLWEGTSDYDPAPLAVTGSSVFWQVQPSLLGTRTSETSHCYLWKAGSSDATAVIDSVGRFATAPTVSGDNLVLTPRVRNDEGTYYGITAYSLSDDLATQVDQLVMPQSVRPFRASRVGDRFLFSVEANYSSGGLLAQMGTYIGTESLGFFRMAREPSEGGCGKGDTFVIKTRSSYVVLNLADQTYSVLYASDRSVDYGEYPARVGEADDLVTFSTVKNSETGYPSSVTVRHFSL